MADEEPAAPPDATVGEQLANGPKRCSLNPPVSDFSGSAPEAYLELSKLQVQGLVECIPNPDFGKDGVEYLWQLKEQTQEGEPSGKTNS